MFWRRAGSKRHLMSPSKLLQDTLAEAVTRCGEYNVFLTSKLHIVIVPDAVVRKGRRLSMVEGWKASLLGKRQQ